MTRAKSIFEYIKLLRLNNPSGFMLLFWPCSFGVLLANEESFRLGMMIFFFIGSIIMRSAGCIINDMIDIEFDRVVDRTKDRPLVKGTVCMHSSIAIMLLLCQAGAVMLFTLNKLSVYIGLIALLLVVAYPFMKRITKYPQAILALAFSIGAPLGYTAIKGELSASAMILYAACCLWSLGYDTIYGLQDREDDIKAGIKSTAVTFGKYSKLFIFFCYLGMVALLAYLGFYNKFSLWFYSFLFLAFVQLMHQVYSLKTHLPINCMRRFKSNAYLGGIIFLALVTKGGYSYQFNINDYIHRAMTKEYTLSIIKPDATARNITEEINQMFIDAGLEIVKQKKLSLTKEQGEQFYIEHKDRPFYGELVNYITSGEVVVQILAGENAISKNREIMGATNPVNAKEGTIRAKYAESIERNSVHGSDSPESAKREINFFFGSDWQQK